ncbi:MAG: hypothetical protein LBD58_06020, partial [Treponema sp.]|nr:hypothetical protein [Treponema sp.]
MRESIGTRGERNKNGMKWKAAWKAAFLFMLFCLKPPDAAHPADIDFAWTLGEFRFAFSNRGGSAGALNFACTVLSFDIFETYTGLGVRISPFSVEDGDSDMFHFFFLPLEIYYNPFVFRVGDWTSFNMGVYVRGGYGFLSNPFAR